ncbi:MAG: HAMP domain-containing protein [Caldilineaceae bacterium]|nr:HAMP domain-containing protein [Caldilineaceae bacterium]
MTIRLRLTLWYTALLGATLILFSVLVYALLATNLWTQVRQNVVRQADDIVDLLTQQLLRTQQLIVIRDSGFGFPELDLFTSGAGAQVINVDGTVYMRSENLGNMVVPNHLSALSKIREGKTYLDYAQSSTNIPFMVYSKPLVVNDFVLGAVQIVQPIDSVENTLNQISRYLILGTALSLVLAAIVGALIAHRALAPIGAITHTASSITRTHDLRRRLQIADSASEVGQLAGTFNDMLDRIQKLFETQERLIADVSHEMRTPLTSMQGNIELLQRMAAADQEPARYGVNKNALLRETLREVEQETQRMSKMINDLLLLAQADSGALQLQLAPVEVDTLLLEVYRQTKRMADLRKGPGALDIRLGHEDQALVWGDQDRLRQLLLNLTDNAIKYTPEGGTITLSLTNEAGWVQVAVRDTGIGILPENQAQIFERFYRTDKARSRELGGSGLGLSIVQWIALAHNGRITVQSEAHQGSTFALWLPELGNHTTPTSPPLA